MKKALTLALVAVMSLGLLTACGGGGGTAKQIQVVMGENGAYAFNPPTLEVTKGETVEVTLINKDTAQAHSFIAKDFNVKSSQVAPGKEEKVKFTASKAGEFAIECDVPGHKDGGMIGKIIVK
jgi:uncharacterized cupredoxin-like copper-binding protein